LFDKKAQNFASINQTFRYVSYTVARCRHPGTPAPRDAGRLGALLPEEAEHWRQRLTE
jgi:hypothetical protein